MARILGALVLAGAALVGCGQAEERPPVTPTPSTSAPVAAASHGSSADPSAPAGAPVDPASVERMPVAVARAHVQAGQALFVCAYTDDRCAEVPLAGSIPWSALQTRLPGLARDQEIILFCD